MWKKLNPVYSQDLSKGQPLWKTVLFNLGLCEKGW